MTDDAIAATAARPFDIDRAVVAFGVALLSTAVVVSARYANAARELDWSTFSVGLLATAGLLGLAAALPRSDDTDADLAAWPGAFGAVALGLMVVVGLDSGGVDLYVAGLAVVAVSGIGFALTRGAPFVVSAGVGLFVLFLNLFDDVFGGFDWFRLDLGRAPVAFALFAVAMTLAGWRLPTRAVAGVTAGTLALLGFAVASRVVEVPGFVWFVLAPRAGLVETSPVTVSLGELAGTRGSDPSLLDKDLWVLLGSTLLLVLFWAGCAAVTRHVGFRVLMVALPVLVIPAAMYRFQASHPSRWGATLVAAGVLALLVVAIRPRRRRAS